ncbi:MAG: SpoIIE family protein phosphatase [Myxococcales bacterium]|nr:SpoIIE family protein phosphatase [Myxococcales bacterium]
MRIELGTAIRALPGERACGDAIAVHDSKDLLFTALIDGLGHGPGAARASIAACEYIADHWREPLDRLIEGCDRAIRPTRGVVMTIVTIERETGRVRHAAVGNVELKYHGAGEIHLLTSPGVVGTRLRKVVVREAQLRPGDTLVMFTDGISSRFDLSTLAGRGAQEIADFLLANHAKEHDDAGCVVIRS